MKKQISKLLSLCLSVLMICGSTQVSALGAETQLSGDDPMIISENEFDAEYLSCAAFNEVSAAINEE